MFKNSRQKLSLAGCLKDNSGSNTSIYDILFNIVNIRKLPMHTRKKLSVLSLTIGLITTTSSLFNSPHAHIPQFIERLNAGGFIYAVFPLLLALYIFERAVKRHLGTQRSLGELYTIIFLVPMPIIIALDLSMFNANYTVLNLALFGLTTAILWPSRRRKSYYSKKHIDNRTK